MATDLERFLETDGREEMIKEVRAADRRQGHHLHLLPVRLGDRPDHGQGRARRPTGRTIARKGFQLVYGATANLFVDRHGDYIGYGPEAWELVGMPEPDTFMPLPWDPQASRASGAPASATARSARTARRLSSPSDCRGNLQRIQAEFEARTGLHLRAGTEPEMMWLKINADGTPAVEGVTKPYCYHIDQFSELQPIIHKVMEYGQAMGLDMIQGDHEDAPGQIELNFNFDRAEKTADNLSTFRQICRQVGRELDVFPCFMPKPFMGVSANGCHHNISLWQGDENMFMPETATTRRCPARSACRRSAASSSTSAR